MKYDFTLLTDHRYLQTKSGNEYISNIFEEDRLLTAALIKLGYSVHRTNWDNPDFDWTQTRFAVFRTTWDYFERIDEFQSWFQRVSNQTIFINPASLIEWNLDKHYLLDISNKGIAIPPTLFLERGEKKTLLEICKQSGWNEFILKPAISGAARHTYRFTMDGIPTLETIFKELISNESMMVQQYMESITSKGEVSMMVFGGKYSHSVLKKAKEGDFRVQDDFGGSLHAFEPDGDEITFAETVVQCCEKVPIYARVDVVWDLKGNLCVSELELIEPELWMRKHPESANRFAKELDRSAGNPIPIP